MNILANDPVIVAYARTPMGKYGGILSTFRPDDLLATVFSQAIKRSNIDPSDIEEFVAGCANQAGEDNRNVARMAQLLAGLPLHASAITLNRLCASGLDALIYAARMVMSGEAKAVVAGGVESMSRAPLVMAKSSGAVKLGVPDIFDTSLGWRFFNENMRSITPPEANGVTAERLAQEFAISRERQDRFALLSHQRAVAAHKDGLLTSEIVSLSLKKNGENIISDTDEGPRFDTSLARLATLKAAFVENGSVTAGNSSPLSDGAAAMVITSHEYAKAHGLNPCARIIGFSSAGVDPKVMGLGPVPATHKLTHKLGIPVSRFDALEINEAFAAQVLAVIDSLKIDEEKVNAHGGAIALGHPLGCSGTRVAISLLNRLTRAQKSLGLATLCVGVGQGLSMAVETL